MGLFCRERIMSSAKDVQRMCLLHRSPFPWNNPRTRSVMPGDLVHTDLCGSMSQISVGGAKYFIMFKDDAASSWVIGCIKSKGEQEVLGCLKRFLGQLRPETGQGLKVLRSD